MGLSQYDPAAQARPAWNAGRKVGAKRALKTRQIWAIRFFAVIGPVLRLKLARRCGRDAPCDITRRGRSMALTGAA
jgi:hypothetical protein